KNRRFHVTSRGGRLARPLILFLSVIRGWHTLSFPVARETCGRFDFHDLPQRNDRSNYSRVQCSPRDRLSTRSCKSHAVLERPTLTIRRPTRNGHMRTS